MEHGENLEKAMWLVEPGRWLDMEPHLIAIRKLPEEARRLLAFYIYPEFDDELDAWKGL